MPRFISTSIDDNLDTDQTRDVSTKKINRLSHATSAIELRSSKQYIHPTTRLRQQKRRQYIHSASSYPLSDISQNAVRSTSDSGSSFSKELFPSLQSSHYDESITASPLTKETPIVSALPSPPTSDCGDSNVLSLEKGHSEDSGGLSFPLDPVSLPTLGRHSSNDAVVPRTPTRRSPRNVPQLCTPSPSPDRYISNRFTPQDASKTFRLSKPPHQLSSPERLLRHNSATPDPFAPLQITRTRDIRATVSSSSSPQVNRPRSRPIGLTNILALQPDPLAIQDRQISAGAVWNVGGGNAMNFAGPVRSVSNGRGGFISSGTNAPMYTSQFFDDNSLDQDLSSMESRLAAALDIDQTSRVLDISRFPQSPRDARSCSVGMKRKIPYVEPRTRWNHGEWIQEGSTVFLDAPSLRDDYYCTVLAYCRTSNTLAVGLANKVYLWSEAFGVRYPPEDPNSRHPTYVTSLSFSSTEGGHSILAIGRSSGQISLWSLYDPENIRFQSQQPCAIACVAFKPVVTRRHSERFGCIMATEELLVGDDFGNVYYYSVEWMSKQQIDIHGWTGVMSLLAKIIVHNQQICGLAWSPDGEYFATGANDNACCLFEIKDFLGPRENQIDSEPLHRRPLQNLLGGFGLPSFIGRSRASSEMMSTLTNGMQVQHTRIISGQSGSLLISEGRQKHRWMHSAAIKAIAFCPWQRGLLATGGGSNDRAIHFYHTFSGACLATIHVHAQVTSLIWSTTRREIAATFGYAQPDHPYRIAVFSWPECRQVVAIPWASDMRALYAIPYPGGPGETTAGNTMGETWYSRTKEEGCIVVACSDESVKFHEIWSGTRKSTGLHKGLLGGSDILESLQGIEKEGAQVIR